MSRVTRGKKGNQKRKKVLKLAKGFRGSRSKLYKVAVNVVKKALSYAYRDRRNRKRDFRRLWITRINAALFNEDISYNTFIHSLKKSNIELDRKVLAGLAVEDPKCFKEVLKTATNN